MSRRCAAWCERDAAIAALDGELTSSRLLIEKLKLQIARLKRVGFGASSEKMQRELTQLELALQQRRPRPTKSPGSENSGKLIPWCAANLSCPIGNATALRSPTEKCSPTPKSSSMTPTSASWAANPWSCDSCTFGCSDSVRKRTNKTDASDEGCHKRRLMGHKALSCGGEFGPAVNPD